MSQVFLTLFSVVEPIGTSACLAIAGIVATHRGFITDESRKSLAELSMNLFMPMLLFTSMVNCDIRHVIQDCWILLIMPLVVVGSGITFGKLLATTVACPENFTKACVGAVAFGNSTGMPITILQILSPKLVKNGIVGVNMLSIMPVYLILYPMLQWTVGSYLFGLVGDSPKVPERSLKEGDAPQISEFRTRSSRTRSSSIGTLPDMDLASYPDDIGQPMGSAPSASIHPGVEDLENPVESREDGASSCCNRLEIARKIVKNVLVPPFIGSALGFIVGVSPVLQGLFVEFPDVAAVPPLSFLFKALQLIGQASVPINMLVLGSNLAKGCDFHAVPLSTSLGILIMKMIGQPGLMTLVITVLSRFLKCDLAIWLVVLIVSCTPTANNIMVMVELSGQNKAGMTTCIFVQYMAAPLVLTLVLSAFLLGQHLLIPYA